MFDVILIGHEYEYSTPKMQAEFRLYRCNMTLTASDADYFAARKKR